MRFIASRDNPRFKALRKLLDHAATRKKRELTVLHGVHLCRAYLRSGHLPDMCVVGKSAQDHSEVAAIVADLADAAIMVLEDALVAQLSELDHAPALLFVIKVPQAGPPPAATPSDRVLLDRLQDPGNLGSILRSCAAFGFHQVLLSPGCAAAWSPKVLRAAMGAHFRLDIREDCDLAALLRQSSMPAFVTSSHALTSLYSQELGPGPCTFVFGNEAQGVSEQLLLASTSVSIPQPGGEESLNVAAAAAVCLAEVARQRALARD